MGPTDTRIAVAHLLRRTGFGATAAQVDALAAGGYPAAVEAVLAPAGVDRSAEAVAPPTFETAAYVQARRGSPEQRAAARRQARAERSALVLWWLQRMAVADQPWREKAAFVWHDHFATSVQKVKLPELMYRQQRTLYELGGGRFDELAAAMVTDPAMLVWLDGADSTAEAPNENFAREFFELFTLGHGAGHEGHAESPYTEDDVVAASKAFTGWTVERTTGAARFRPARHDAGTKTVLGVSGPLGADDVVAAATGSAACAPHVVSRLWSRLARPAGPDDPVVQELADQFADDLDITALVRRMLLHDDFVADTTRAALVKTPIEYVVGCARALGVPITRRHIAPLRALGQVPFLPPDVAGWPANEGWLSTSSALVRLEVATSMAAAADLTLLEEATPRDRPAAVARLLSVERWSKATLEALAGAPDARTLLIGALVAPEHVLN